MKIQLCVFLILLFISIIISITGCSTFFHSVPSVSDSTAAFVYGELNKVSGEGVKLGISRAETVLLEEKGANNNIEGWTGFNGSFFFADVEPNNFYRLAKLIITTSSSSYNYSRSTTVTYNLNESYFGVQPGELKSIGNYHLIVPYNFQELNRFGSLGFLSTEFKFSTIKSSSDKSNLEILYNLLRQRKLRGTGWDDLLRRQYHNTLAKMPPDLADNFLKRPEPIPLEYAQNFNATLGITTLENIKYLDAEKKDNNWAFVFSSEYFHSIVSYPYSIKIGPRIEYFHSTPSNPRVIMFSSSTPVLDYEYTVSLLSLMIGTAYETNLLGTENIYYRIAGWLGYSIARVSFDLETTEYVNPGSPGIQRYESFVGTGGNITAELIFSGELLWGENFWGFDIGYRFAMFSELESDGESEILGFSANQPIKDINSNNMTFNFNGWILAARYKLKF